MNNSCIPLVIPTISSDLPKILYNIDRLLHRLPINKIYIIGPGEIKHLLPVNEYLIFINENDLINTELLINTFKRRCVNSSEYSRIGWYIQQFIKMEFSLISQDEYYLLWDSDTLPTKIIDLFDSKNKPYFDLKTEYHKPYFDTLSKLIPTCKKEFKASFIAEHMLIKSNLMRNLIHTIESNSRIDGINYKEKILNAIAQEELGKCGFSEFETYGNYVSKYFPKVYSYRKWNSLRYGAFFFNYDIDYRKLRWLSKYYDAISFEKGHKLSIFSNIVNKDWFSKIHPFSLRILTLLVRMKRRIFKS